MGGTSEALERAVFGGYSFEQRRCEPAAAFVFRLYIAEQLQSITAFVGGDSSVGNSAAEPVLSGEQEAEGRKRRIYIGGVMAIQVHLDEILKERRMTSKELCRMVEIGRAHV